MGRLLVASAVEPGTFVWFLGFEFVTELGHSHEALL